MHVRLILLSCLCAVLSLPAPAHAQTNDDFRVMEELEQDHARLPTECGDGLVSSEATQGHCCWPGQAWSEERQRCAGPPTCPAGWQARGSLCIRGEYVKELGDPPPGDPPKPAVDAPKTVPEPVREAPKPAVKPEGKPIDLGVRSRGFEPEELRGKDRVPYKGGTVPPGWTVVSRSRPGLIIPGSIILGVFYSLSALTAFGQLAGGDGCGDKSTAMLGFVPVVGPLAAGVAQSATCGGPDAGLTWGLVSSGHQIAGLVMIIVGVKNPNRELVREVPSEPVSSWKIVPGTQTTSQGLSIAGRF